MRVLSGWGRHVSVHMAVLGLAITTFSAAAVAAPASVSYTGELRAENGVLYSGNVDVVAELFATAAGDDSMWGPQDLGSVSVSQGLLSLSIGGMGAPANLDTVLAGNDTLWLQLSIDGVALQPRQRIESTPYSRVADTALRLGGTDAADYVTETELADFPITAFVDAEPPADPQPGQLWLDTDLNKVFVWAAGAWQPVSASGLIAGDLPGDGLIAVSNNTLSNEFFNVYAEWGMGPADIIDDAPAGTNAIISVDEGASAELRDILLSAVIQFDVISDVQIVLQAPVALGVAPIVLFSGPLTADPGTTDTATFVWDTSVAEIGALIGEVPAGTWTLNVVDTEKNLVAPPFVVGQLASFEILYDVLRSDEVNVQGTMGVQQDLNVKGNAVIEGDVEIQGDLSVAGMALLPRYYRSYATDETGNNLGSPAITSRNLTFTKRFAASSVRIEWHDNTRCNGNAVDCGWELLIDGKQCSVPGPITLYKYNASDSGQNFHYASYLAVICDQLAGEPGPMAPGEHTVSMTFRDPGGSANGDYHTGWSGQHASIMVSEVIVE